MNNFSILMQSSDDNHENFCHLTHSENNHSNSNGIDYSINSATQRKNSISELIQNDQKIIKVCDLTEENLKNLKRLRKYHSLT